MAPLLSSDLRLTGPRYVWLHIVHIYLVLVLVTVQYSTVQYSTVQYSTVLVLVNVLKVVQLQHNLLAYLLWLKKVILQTSLSSLSALNTHFTEHIHSLELSTKFLQNSDYPFEDAYLHFHTSLPTRRQKFGWPSVKLIPYEQLAKILTIHPWMYI